MTFGLEPHMDLQDFRDQQRRVAQAKRDARRDFERYRKEEAEADRDFRMLMARVYAEKRIEGESANGAELIARGEAAEAKLRRDLAASLAKSAELRIAELEGDRTTVRDIGEWSRKLEHIAA